MEAIQKMADPPNTYRHGGDENDVLGRFFETAVSFRWHPDSVIFRFTPDDVQKRVDMMLQVADGARHPVELGGEAFTLSMLREAQTRFAGIYDSPFHREHITHAIFQCPAPPAPPGTISVDTEADLIAANAQ